MKELSIEQKAKRYDEAKYIMEEYLKSGNAGVIAENTIKHAFPELKESEDAMMVKFIKNQLFNIKKTITDNYELDAKLTKAIDWLEKQGDKKSINDLTQQEAMDIAVAKCSEQGEQKPVFEMKTPEESLGIDSDTYNKIVDECIYNEQKSANKVEPKFKVGDWVVNNTTLNLCHIVKVEHGQYICDDCSFPITKENKYHLWTIQDAKDGDVLIGSGNVKYSNGIKYERIYLFNNFDNAYFTLTKYSNHVEEYDIDMNVDYPDNTVPATKKQKEILFMAMNGAGYEWDAEKKKLKKIEKKPSKNKGMNLKEEEMTPFQKEVFCIIDTAIEAEIGLKQECDILLALASNEIKQQSAWSEEDEIFAHGLIRGLATKRDIHGHTTFSSDCIDITETINWLNSLKDRVQPQQRQEWNKEDEYILLRTINDLKFLKDTISIDPNYTVNIIDIEREIKWFESLKDRVQQPKQEWSEEDERTYKSITYSFAHNYPLTVQQQEFVKSIKYRYSWKPSDDQMRALNGINLFGGIYYIGQEQELINLYNDLKKLKEE